MDKEKHEVTTKIYNSLARAYVSKFYDSLKKDGDLDIVMKIISIYQNDICTVFDGINDTLENVVERDIALNAGIIRLLEKGDSNNLFAISKIFRSLACAYEKEIKELNEEIDSLKSKIKSTI